MELRHLRYFAAVAEAENFTRGAAMQRVSQPALSQQIRELEDELGTTLFDRQARKARLTPAGAIFYEYVKRVFAHLEDGKAALQGLAALESGDLTVGVVHTVNAYLIPRVVALFKRRYPGVSLHVRELDTTDMERELLEGGIHIGIGFVPGCHPQMESEPVFSEELVAIVNKDHSLAQHKQVQFAELARESLILLPNGFCTRKFVDSFFQDKNLMPHIAVELDSIETILNVVHELSSVTILPAMAMKIPVATNLKALRIVDPSPARGIGFLWAKGAYKRPAARAFADMFLAHSAQA